MLANFSNTRKLCWDWRPALTRGTVASTAPVLGKRMAFEGVRFRVLSWRGNGVEHKRPVSDQLRPIDAVQIARCYKRRQQKLADLLDAREGALELLAKYTGLVAPFIESAAVGANFVEGGFAEVVESVLGLPPGWFDSDSEQLSEVELDWPGWGEPAVVSQRESGKAALIDDWVTPGQFESGKGRRLAPRHAAMNLPFPVSATSGTPSGLPALGDDQEAGCLTPVALQRPMRFRRLSKDNARLKWIQRVTTTYLLTGASRNHFRASKTATETARTDPLVSPASRWRTVHPVQSALPQSPAGQRFSPKPESLLARENVRQDAVREKKMQNRAKNIWSFRTTALRDDLLCQLLSVDNFELDDVRWTRDPVQVSLLTGACEIPFDWFDWPREGLEIRRVARRFVEHVPAVFTAVAGKLPAGEAEMSADEILQLWSGPRAEVVETLSRSGGTVGEQNGSGKIAGKESLVERPLETVPAVETGSLGIRAPDVEDEHRRGRKRSSRAPRLRVEAPMPARFRAEPELPATLGARVQSALTAVASGWAELDEYSVLLAAETMVDPLVAGILRSVAPGDRPIFDALMQKLDKLARTGKLDESKALELLTKVAAL